MAIVISRATHGDGVCLEFQGKAGYDLVTKSLEDRRSKIRLLNVRQEKDATIRTFWMPVVNNHGGFGRWTFIEISDP